jgi:hypothetical protein
MVRYFEDADIFEKINVHGAVARETDAFGRSPDYMRAVKVNQELAVYGVLLFTDTFPRDYERQLFDILCEAFERILEKQYSTFIRDRSVADYFLMDLLDNPDMPPEKIRERCTALAALTGYKGYALGTGNSIPNYVPPENFKAMIRVVYPEFEF